MGLVVVQLPRLLVEPTVIQRTTTFFVLTSYAFFVFVCLFASNVSFMALPLSLQGDWNCLLPCGRVLQQLVFVFALIDG